jgi:hypothetical protein
MYPRIHPRVVLYDRPLSLTDFGEEVVAARNGLSAAPSYTDCATGRNFDASKSTTMT